MKTLQTLEILNLPHIHYFLVAINTKWTLLYQWDYMTQGHWKGETLGFLLRKNAADV